VNEAEPRTLIDDLLDEQRRLTAVERFALKHDQHQFPAQEKYYRDLIPLNAPQPGEQYAFAVSLDTCTGCKACVSACHSLNGLDDGELWRSVGLLQGGTRREPWQQTVTTACHHCEDPACANGCPVLAYEKDEATGIVRHLDDQCIGCQYCVLKCPYDVPKYSKERGIVRKCDMCQGRLAAGEAPACVQACPNEAIRIEIVKNGASSSERMLPATFESSYTRPTTSYRSSRAMPENARSADALELRLEHAHWPLILMLVLTQAAAGTYAAALAFPPLVYAATLLLHAGLAISVLHLGRPMGAWRFFLGLRKSWMSREILAFGVFAGAGVAFAAATFFGLGLARMAGVATIVCAVAAVACSAMIYVDTRRPWWSAPLAFGRFFGSTTVLGIYALAVALASPLALCAAVVAHWVLTGWETQVRLRALEDDEHPAHRPAFTAKKLLGAWTDFRMVAVLLGGVCSVCSIVAPSRWPFVVAALLAVTAVIIERYEFFTAACAPRMPGGNAR
jgi:formate dehydrogenase iron-sulfur subunit